MYLRYATFSLVSSIWAVSLSAQTPPATQIPAVIKAEVLNIQDRFASALEEECGVNRCYSVGCEVGRFLTLDEQQTSSLPGLETTTPTTASPQYKLASARCEFTYEASLSDSALATLRQRLVQKVKPVGVSINLVSRKLESRSDLTQANDTFAVPTATWYGALYAAFLPFIPWLTMIILGVLGALALLWGYRRLGKQQQTHASSTVNALVPSLERESGPTPMQIMNRLKHLNEALNEDYRVAEIALKADLDSESFSSLSLFLKHFGPQLLVGFKDRHEYRETLSKLAQVYKEDKRDESATELWSYLDKLERSIVAAKVQVDQEPLESEFSFLEALSVEELIGILSEVSEKEAVAAIAYAPRNLRERFFSQSNPAFTVNFIELLTEVDKLPDSFVRSAAKKIREIYYSKGESLRTANVDKYPLLEQALNALDPSQRKQMLLGMSKENPTLIKNLAPALFLDESLIHINDELLTEAFLTGDPEDLANFLMSLDSGRQLYNRLNKRVQETIAPYLIWGRNVDTKRVSTGRTAIANYVKQLDARGIINLRAINERILF